MPSFLLNACTRQQEAEMRRAGIINWRSACGRKSRDVEPLFYFARKRQRQLCHDSCLNKIHSYTLSGPQEKSTLRVQFNGGADKMSRCCLKLQIYKVHCGDINTFNFISLYSLNLFFSLLVLTGFYISSVKSLVFVFV